MMKLLGKDISGVFTIPSGIVTTNVGIIKKFADEIPQIGVLTTKSIGLLPKTGNIEPILAELPEKQTYINAVGLGNPGCEAFRDEVKEIYPLKDKFLLISIFDSSPEGLIKIAKTLENYADGFELNFSCPHAEKGYGIHIGTSCKLTEMYTRKLKAETRVPIFVKMTPNVENYEEIVEAAIRAGADGITAINTVGPVENDVLSHGKGGISGLAVKKRALECVSMTRRVARKLGKKDEDFPIIGMGGVMDANDSKEFIRAGASIVGIGSALTGLDTEGIKNYFNAIEKDMKGHTNNSNNYVIKEKFMQYEAYHIKRIEQVDHDLRIFYFDRPVAGAKPGHYMFCWIKDTAEKPFSLAGNNPAMLIIRAVGPFTRKMFELREGDSLKMRGPHGTAYDLEAMENAILVGGGTGIAPLYHLALHNRPVAVFIGGRTRQQLLLKKEFENICPTFVATNDGTEGYHGYVTDLLKIELDKGLGRRMKSFTTAGPEIMMKKAADIASQHLPREKIILSMERYYKCGVGICGVCECDGLRTCVDGPIISVEKVNKGFGVYHRDKSGKKELLSH